MSVHRSQRDEQLISNKRDVYLDVQNQFYDPERQGIRNLVNEFGVDYYVMLKDKSEAIEAVVNA